MRIELFPELPSGDHSMVITGQNCERTGMAGCGAILLVWTLACPSLFAEDLKLSWEKNYLAISGPTLPGKSIKVHYLEAYCRAGSTDADWVKHTRMQHTTQLVSSNPEQNRLELECVVEDGVRVTHVITSTEDEVAFQIVAKNPTERRSEAHWAQPCIRLDKFTGANQQGYLAKSFIFVDGKLSRMPTEPWATKARYEPGQVWVPQGVDRNDVNPRPLSSIVPSNGLIGCYSQDESMIFATAFEPYQELFQGVAVCLHADFRLGGLLPGERKEITGRIYILPNDESLLLKRYRKDFPTQGQQSQ